MDSPVLFLVFNRPATTHQVFEAIRAARPPRLYIAADGARSNRAGEAAQCAEVRRIATAVDWPCEVKTLFRENNLGCKVAVSRGLDWFFQHEEQGIVLEDDVLPVPGFFQYCDELLHRFRDHAHIGLISGCNLVSSEFSATDSYFFSRNCHIWGWASWRRVWQTYDVAITAWPTWRQKNFADVPNTHALFRLYWSRIFDSVHAGRIDTWDYQLVFALWRNRQLCVIPAVNQVTNLGFGPDGTHTLGEAPGYVTRSVPAELAHPLRHPEPVASNVTADRLIDRLVFGLDLAQMLKRKVRSWLSRPWRQ